MVQSDPTTTLISGIKADKQPFSRRRPGLSVRSRTSRPLLPGTQPADDDYTPASCEGTALRAGREEDTLEVISVSTVPWWLRSRKRPMTVLDLPCAERTVGLEAALRLPTVMMLVVEDTCTQIACEDWRHREPPRWRPAAHHRWCSEGQRLQAKKARVKELAIQCLDAPD